MMHLDEVPIFRFLESRTQTGVFSAVFSIISYWYMYMILLSLAMLWGVLYGVGRSLAAKNRFLVILSGFDGILRKW